MSGQNGLAYHPEAGITWVKDAGQTLLTDGLGGRLWILQGLEAAAWDLLVLGYSFESAARSLALLAGSGDEGGRAALSAMVRRWQGAGLLCVPEGNRP